MFVCGILEKSVLPRSWSLLTYDFKVNMIFKHKTSGKHYRAITRGFSVELQVTVIVYMCLTTGAVFVRAEDQFRNKMDMVGPAEDKISPRKKIETGR